MKKIINGKVYDTEKATIVGSYSSDYPRNDFNFFEEELFRKRTGEYFLHGSGGPMTRYSVYEYGMHSSGEKIVLQSYEEAKEWSWKHLSPEEYEKEFGVISEDESTETINISLKASDVAKLRRMAQIKGCSLSSLIASFAE